MITIIPVHHQAPPSYWIKIIIIWKLIGQPSWLEAILHCCVCVCWLWYLLLAVRVIVDYVDPVYVVTLRVQS